MLCESDRKLMEYVAILWVDSGGDAKSFDWNYRKLKEMIQDEFDRRNSEQYVEIENNET